MAHRLTKETETMRGVWIGDTFIRFRTITPEQLQLLAERGSRYVEAVQEPETDQPAVTDETVKKSKSKS